MGSDSVSSGVQYELTNTKNNTLRYTLVIWELYTPGDNFSLNADLIQLNFSLNAENVRWLWMWEGLVWQSSSHCWLVLCSSGLNSLDGSAWEMNGKFNKSIYMNMFLVGLAYHISLLLTFEGCVMICTLTYMISKLKKCWHLKKNSQRPGKDGIQETQNYRR